MLTVRILSSAPLPLPSASGIELVGDTAYVISDDAPFLYSFRAADLAPNDPIRLFETAHFSSGRIPKALKPDLEGMAYLPPTATAPGGLLLAGSGATPARETGYWVADAAAPGGSSTVYPVSLKALYQELRASLPLDQALNIEALATTDTHLWLFHRPVGTPAGRACFRVPLGAVRTSFRQPAIAPPVLRPLPYAVPAIDGQPGGLSGATSVDGRLFVTVSVEKTHDPVHDGEVLGSCVGILDPARPDAGEFAQLAWADGRPFREKVEGISVRRRLGPQQYELLLVTDDDRGGSTVLVAELTVD